MGRFVIAVAVWLVVSLAGSGASADMMCGGPKRPIPPADPPPPGSSSPRTRPVGAAGEASPTGRAPVAPVELGMMAGMVLLGGGAAVSSRGRGRGKSFR